MANGIPQKTPHYCYHCGNRLLKDSDRCWYCGSPVQRQIYRERRCPFCAEIVRPEAVKCKHCGEFLDGRPQKTPAEQRPVNQMIVIDKELLKGLSDLRLFPGVRVPDEARKVLDTRTVKAIEENHPEDIEARGVQLLPAPDSAPIVVEGGAEDGGLVQWKPQSAPPARRGDTETRPARIEPEDDSAGIPAPPGMRWAGPPAKRKGAVPARREQEPLAPRKKKKPKDEEVIEADVQESFRKCANCATEILVTDNFCYHCGTQYRTTQRDKLRAKKARRESMRKAFWTFVVLVILAAAAVGAYLYFTGAFTGEDIRNTGEKVVEGARGTLSRGMEELGVVSDQAIADAEQCRANLRAIQTAKQAVVTDLGLNPGDAVPEAAVIERLPGKTVPTCPSGGTYSLNPAGRAPICSIGEGKPISEKDDHILPAAEANGP